jgi:hypothetical protein
MSQECQRAAEIKVSTKKLDLDGIKVQLLGNEGLSQVCFLDLGHFGLISSCFVAHQISI